jgi:NitT/TauT family transport system substrate-binding protein
MTMGRFWIRTAVFLLAMAGSGGIDARAETLDYRLKWLFNASVAGDMYADVHGFFAAEGLTVNLKPGGRERDAIRELEMGQTDFGVASADQAIRARAKGAPVVVLAQLFQVNPLQWIQRADRPPIRELADLKGRTVGVTYGGNDEIIMRTLLDRAGLTERDVRFFSVGYDYTPFFRDRVDLWPVYRNAQGPILAERLRAEGEDSRFFRPTDFGIRFVANSVITSERNLARSPEIAERFVRALMAGWRAAMDPENAEKTLAMLARFDRDTAPDILRTQLDMTREMVLPDAETIMGAIDRDAWAQTERILRERNQIDRPVDVESILRPARSVRRAETERPAP